MDFAKADSYNIKYHAVFTVSYILSFWRWILVLSLVSWFAPILHVALAYPLFYKLREIILRKPISTNALNKFMAIVSGTTHMHNNRIGMDISDINSYYNNHLRVQRDLRGAESTCSYIGGSFSRANQVALNEL